jgi:mono/diheme cytochrome c family protein
MARPIPVLFLRAAATMVTAASGEVAPGAPSGYRYTIAEATRGEAVYAARCAACHGSAMDGIQDAPPLVGARFDSHWRDQPADLFSKVKLSMPQDDPGSLTAAQAADVVAAILHVNGVQPAASDAPRSPR